MKAALEQGTVIHKAIEAILQGAKTTMKPVIPSGEAPEDQTYLVTVKVNWSYGPYAWASPLDRSGSVERTILVEILSGEPISEEIKRLVEMKLKEEFVKVDFEFVVIGLERI